MYTNPSIRAPTIDRMLPKRSVSRPNAGERKPAVNPLAVTRIPICQRSTSNSSIKSTARTPKALWEKVATPIAVAVTAAIEKRLNGRVEGEPRDM
jgi:hypothetical protein